MHNKKEKRYYREKESDLNGVEQSIVSLKTRKKKRGIENGRRARKVVDWNTSNLNTCPFWFWSSKNERHEYLWWYRSLISKACDSHLYIWCQVNQSLLSSSFLFFFLFLSQSRSFNYEITSLLQLYCSSMCRTWSALVKIFSFIKKKNKKLWIYY